MKKLLCFAAIAASSLVQAAPTGLAIMPIADILRHREFLLLSGSTGFERSINKGYVHSIAGTLGLFDRLEIGSDYDYLGHWVHDAKLQLLSEKELKGGALSIGTQGFTAGKGDWYTVGRYDLKNCRLHCGYLNSDEGHLMVGVDAPWREKTVTLEYMGGRGSRLTGSIILPIAQLPGLSLQLVGSMPMKRSEGFEHTVFITYGFRL